MPRIISLIAAQELDLILPERILVAAPHGRARNNRRQPHHAPFGGLLDRREHLWAQKAAEHSLSGTGGEEHVRQHATEEPQLQERVVLGQLRGMHLRTRDG